MLVKMRLLRLIESCTASSRIESWTTSSRIESWTASSRIEDSFLPRLEPFGDR